jgi:hypothetical protein
MRINNLASGEFIASRFPLETLPASLPHMRWVRGTLLELKRPERAAS